MPLGDIKQPEAVKILEETARLFPPPAETYNNLGYAFYLSGRFKEAISAFKNALTLAPNDELLRFNLAVAQLSVKDKSSALAQYSFLKNSNPELAQELFDVIYRNFVVAANQK